MEDDDHCTIAYGTYSLVKKPKGCFSEWSLRTYMAIVLHVLLVDCRYRFKKRQSLEVRYGRNDCTTICVMFRAI